MNPQKAAIIDIGSNSIRYMEAVKEDGLLSFSRKEVVTTRLASGLISTGLLSDASISLSLNTIIPMYEKAIAGGFHPYAYATSAVRDAKNREAFTGPLLKLCPTLSLQVLSGEAEARYAFQGAAEGNGGLIDIGGGSAQIVTDSFCKSYPLGCVRVRDLTPSPILADIRSAAASILQSVFSDLPETVPSHVTMVGGTATTIAAFALGLSAYDAQKVATLTLDGTDIPKLLEELDSLGAEGRRNTPILKRRHDVILCGGVILEYLVNVLHIGQLSFSDADGMEGLAKEILS